MTFWVIKKHFLILIEQYPHTVEQTVSLLVCNHDNAQNTIS